MQSRRMKMTISIFCALIFCALQASAQQSPQVRLSVRVVDNQNRPVRGVQQEELRVFEDDAPQTITFFSAEELPLTYTLVVDNSGSLRAQLDYIVRAARNIIASNRPGDEASLVRFVGANNIQLQQDFTSDPEALLAAADNLYVEGGQTAIVDAIRFSHQRITRHASAGERASAHRRALILITDGEDRDSFYRQEQLFSQLRETDVQIFVIGLASDRSRRAGRRATEFLERIAAETGGHAFFPRSPAEMQAISSELTNHIRAQYVVGYTANTPNANAYRRVRVEVINGSESGRRAITRAGYNVTSR